MFLFSVYFVAWLGGIGTTMGAHRLWTHRSYKARRPLRIILIIMQTIAGEVRKQHTRKKISSVTNFSKFMSAQRHHIFFKDQLNFLILWSASATSGQNAYTTIDF